MEIEVHNRNGKRATTFSSTFTLHQVPNDPRYILVDHGFGILDSTFAGRFVFDLQRF